MQPLDDATIACPGVEECASLVIETVLLGMRTIRSEVKSGRSSELTVPQFRVLAILNRHQGASLSELAEHIGLTLPSMSKAVDWLVKQGMVRRSASVDDRRRITLELTEEGRRAFQVVADCIRDRMAGLLSELSPDERMDVVRGMNALRSVLPSRMYNP